MSKGSKPRPFSVDKETFSKNWDAIFNKKSKNTVENTSIDCSEDLTKEKTKD